MVAQVRQIGRVSDTEWELIKTGAKLSNMTFTSWATKVLLRAARRVGVGPRKPLWAITIVGKDVHVHEDLIRAVNQDDAIELFRRYIGRLPYHLPTNVRISAHRVHAPLSDKYYISESEK